MNLPIRRLKNKCERCFSHLENFITISLLDRLYRRLEEGLSLADFRNLFFFRMDEFIKITKVEGIIMKISCRKLIFKSPADKYVTSTTDKNIENSYLNFRMSTYFIHQTGRIKKTNILRAF